MKRQIGAVLAMGKHLRIGPVGQLRAGRWWLLLCLATSWACHYVPAAKSLSLSPPLAEQPHQAFVASVQVDVQQVDKHIRLRGDVVVAWPDKLRLVLLGPHGGAVFALVSDGSHLHGVDFVQQQVWYGQVGQADIGAVLPIPLPWGLSVRHFVAIWFGNLQALKPWQQVAASADLSVAKSCQPLLWQEGSWHCEAVQCSHLVAAEPRLVGEQLQCFEQEQLAWQLNFADWDRWGLPKQVDLVAHRPTACHMQWQLHGREMLAQPKAAIFTLRIPPQWPVLPFPAAAPLQPAPAS